MNRLAIAALSIASLCAPALAGNFAFEIRKAGFECAKAHDEKALEADGQPVSRVAVYCDDGARGQWYLVTMNNLTFAVDIEPTNPPS